MAFERHGALVGAAQRIAALLMFIAVWWIAAALAQSRALPSPDAVLAVGVERIASGELPYNLVITLLRVLAAYVVAMAIGSAIGIAMGRSAALNRFGDIWLIVLLNMPALVVAVLAYVWFGLTEAAAIGAVAVNKIPTVAVTMREGARSLDPSYEEMARVFRFSPRSMLTDVYVPQLVPYFSAASRSGLALIWKIVLVVELLGRSNGVGFQINLAFQLFDVTAVLAYAAAFVIVMVAVEMLLVQPLEAHATRWRTRPA